MKQFLIIVSLFLLGCNDSVKTGLLEVSVIDVAECPVKNPFLKDSVPHKWRFVKLETSDSCLIGQIKKLLFVRILSLFRMISMFSSSIPREYSEIGSGKKEEAPKNS